MAASSEVGSVLGVLGDELVDQHAAVMADHRAGERAVVVLVLIRAAAAGVEPLVADPALLVLVLEMVSLSAPPAWGSHVDEVGGCGGHPPPPIRMARSRRPACAVRRCADEPPVCASTPPGGTFGLFGGERWPCTVGQHAFQGAGCARSRRLSLEASRRCTSSRPTGAISPSSVKIERMS